MEKNFFDADLPLWRAINLIGDLCFLGLIWILSALPVVTLGASTTAIYYVVLRMARKEDGYLIRGYWKSFKQNFKQATVLWLLVLLLGLFFGFDIYYYGQQAGTLSGVIRGLFIGMGLLLLIVTIYLFPLISRFANTNRRMLSMAIFLPFKHFGWTVVLVLCALVFAFLGWYIRPFIFFFFGFYAYTTAFIFTRIFRPYEEAILRQQGKEIVQEKAEQGEAQAADTAGTTNP